ncbi:shikimate kinase [Prochlorococcus sp. MIT 1341]|uniref:shikimate kinase n=1 Tax=Prochlorococcus sp. MIT 1341 TaxID=3096221 RepID=UPI002A74A910|nr:shikimate kinase [Prochlorococcus sp. MIT 1341]
MGTFSSNHPLKERLGGRNLYLIGMMGSGKSSTAVPLAKMLDYKFIDIDEIIEKSTKKSIQRIFAEDGESSFRAIEHQVLNEVGQHHSLIVATGGGVVTNSENWGILHQGIVIWLKLHKSDLLKRLKADSNERPLLQGKELASRLDKLLEERNQQYSEADLHISIKNESPKEVALTILTKLPSILKSLHDLS